MAKQRQVVSVHIDIAALVWATRGLNSESEWAEWGRSFVEALATQSPEKNQFAAQLIGEVVEFREKEAERVRLLREQSVQSVQGDVQTERKKVSKSVKKEKESSAARKPDPIWDEVENLFFPDGIMKSQAARIGKIVRDLKSISATPEQIRTKTEIMRRSDWGKIAGPEGLIKQWSNIGPKAPAKPRFSETDDSEYDLSLEDYG